jgi:molybdopterin/thiamine biosynthesis adenylyltransferase
LLGAGTLGSTIAEELIKSGVGNLTIVDYDSLEIGNVCRHRLGLNYVGQNKARALKTELLQKNPFAKINVFTSNPLLKPEEFLSNIEAADLIISCFGNDSIELFVNAV